MANLLLAWRGSKATGDRRAHCPGRGARTAGATVSDRERLAFADRRVSGLFVGWLGVRSLVALGPNNILRLSEVGLSGQVFAFTSALTILTGVVFVSRRRCTPQPNLNESLKEGGRGTTEGRPEEASSALIVSEIALALVLLVGAGLMTCNMRLQQVDPGFKPERVVTALLSLPVTKYPEGPQVVDFYHQLEERVRALPGIESAALSSNVPLALTLLFSSTGGRSRGPMSINRIRFSSERVVITATMGIQSFRGQNFAERYPANAPGVAIISQSMARVLPG